MNVNFVFLPFKSICCKINQYQEFISKAFFCGISEKIEYPCLKLSRLGRECSFWVAFIHLYKLFTKSITIEKKFAESSQISTTRQVQKVLMEYCQFSCPFIKCDKKVHITYFALNLKEVKSKKHTHNMIVNYSQTCLFMVSLRYFVPQSQSVGVQK